MIVPDGCRDLIFRHVPGERPEWSIAPLDESVRTVDVEAGTRMTGFRLRPGVRIDADRLLAAVQGRDPDSSEIAERIHAFVALPKDVPEVLDALATTRTSIARAASALGVSARTLQRLLLRETDRPPLFWLQLARVRKAAVSVRRGDALAEIAFEHGFSDQAHLTRQLRRWLGITPAKLRDASSLHVALEQSGYP